MFVKMIGWILNVIWIWLPLASIAVIKSKTFKNSILKRSKIYWGWFTNFHFRIIKRGSKKLEKGYSFVLPWFLCINNPEQVSSCIKHTCLKHLLHTFERAIIRSISRCRKTFFCFWFEFCVRHASIIIDLSF